MGSCWYKPLERLVNQKHTPAGKSPHLLTRPGISGEIGQRLWHRQKTNTAIMDMVIDDSKLSVVYFQENSTAVKANFLILFRADLHAFTSVLHMLHKGFSLCLMPSFQATYRSLTCMVVERRGSRCALHSEILAPKLPTIVGMCCLKITALMHGEGNEHLVCAEQEYSIQTNGEKVPIK